MLTHLKNASYEILLQLDVVGPEKNTRTFFSFALMLYVPVDNLQSCQGDSMSSWVEPVLSSG